MSVTTYSPEDQQLHQGIKRLSVVAFVAIVIVYVAILQGITIFLTRDLDVEYAAPPTVEQLWRHHIEPAAAPAG